MKTIKLEQQLIMTIGETANEWTLTKEMVEASLDTFGNVPIVLNDKAKFKNYLDENFSHYGDLTVIGYIDSVPDVFIEGNDVYADIIIFDRHKDLWKGKFDNWCLQMKDNKNWSLGFELVSIEVF
jgi:hypothetical protein